MIDQIKTEHIEIMKHTRDGAANGLFCGDSEEMRELVEAGLMEYTGRLAWVPDKYFKLTKKGQFFFDTRKGQEK